MEWLIQDFQLSKLHQVFQHWHWSEIGEESGGARSSRALAGGYDGLAWLATWLGSRQDDSKFFDLLLVQCIAAVIVLKEMNVRSLGSVSFCWRRSTASILRTDRMGCWLLPRCSLFFIISEVSYYCQILAFPMTTLTLNVDLCRGCRTCCWKQKMSWRRRQRLNGIPRTNCHITNGSFLSAPVKTNPDWAAWATLWCLVVGNWHAIWLSILCGRGKGPRCNVVSLICLADNKWNIKIGSAVIQDFSTSPQKYAKLLYSSHRFFCFQSGLDSRWHCPAASQRWRLMTGWCLFSTLASNFN